MATAIDDNARPMAVQQARRRSSMDWFYRILDVEYGTELAVADANRLRSPEAAGISFIINALLFTAFLGVWARYDLWSTINYFAPVRDNIIASIPTEGAGWGMVRTLGSYLLGIASAFFTTLIQWAYPRIAQKHDAAMWGLAAAAIFDLVTDYKDVQVDFPGYAKGLLDQLSAQTPESWALVGGVAAMLGLFMASYRSLLWLLAGASFACLFWPAREVWGWGIVFVGTIFASFVAQSLVMIHAMKALALVRIARGAAQSEQRQVGE